jgi:hypothetical protein
MKEGSNEDPRLPTYLLILINHLHCLFVKQLLVDTVPMEASGISFPQ